MSASYDHVSRFYDVDMARNMPFDDVGFYATRCERGNGAVLELGCGNGRILLPLLRRGLDAWGVDASPAMLADLHRKAEAQGVAVHALEMDVRELKLPRRFATILCPYSLVTYLTEDADLRAMLDAAWSHLLPGGQLVIDAFVPRPVQAMATFRLDYRRAFGDATLARSKRVRPAGPRTNRIERRYEVIDRRGKVVDRHDTVETIRPFTSDELRAGLVAAGFRVDATWWDYGTRAEEEGAQFFTLRARGP